MKILFLTDWFLPHAGGARVYYHNLLRRLSEDAGHDVTVLTKKLPGWSEFDRTENRPGYRIVRAGYPLGNWKYYQLPRIATPMLRALLLLCFNKFDLILFGDLYPQGLIAFLLKCVFGIPYIAFCHGDEIIQTDRWRYQPKMRDWIFRGADVVVAANEFAVRNLLRVGVQRDRIHKINPGVDLDLFLPRNPPLDMLQRHGLLGKRVLLTVSRLAPGKGHAVVIEALRQLVPKFDNLVYVVVGVGPEESTLRNLVRKSGLESSVYFVGLVPHDELGAYYQASDLLVLPGTESFGMVFLEANACGKAVVGALSGGSDEAIVHGTTGLLVAPNDLQELVSVLETLLRDGCYRELLGQQGLNRVRAQFKWDTAARELDRISRDILAPSSTECNEDRRPLGGRRLKRSATGGN